MDGNTLEMLSVTISGGVFSLLLYENVKHKHGQDGFLLGKVEFKETKKLTDADHWVINKENVIKIRAIVPCPEQFHFYDSAGRVNEEKIRNFLGHNETDVVGWYIYRPTRSSMKLLLREKIVHKQLAHFFHLPVHHFSCCTLLTDWSANKSTHSLSQTFVRYNNGSYVGIPLHIKNLSDPMCAYKTGENPSEIVNNIMKKARPNKAGGHLFVKNVQEVLQQKVKDLVLKVSEREQFLYALESEIKELNSCTKLKGRTQPVVNLNRIEGELLENYSQSKKLLKETPSNQLISSEL